ncbi:MAG TPA: hypothetical protein VMN36_18160 [Verrucomicrobiales bacterium]|nr:hypothetical protein [Verrucomicrobiales bacterium]
MKTLPDKPSELIRLAVRDLEKIEGDGRYQICMAQWHFPVENGPCLVCLAGAVMSRTLGAGDREVRFPLSFGKRNAGRLLALESLARGGFREAFSRMDIEAAPPLMDYGMLPYREDPEQFKADLLTVADYFEEGGF